MPLPVDKFHRQEWKVAQELDRVDRDDARVVQRGHHLRLALEAVAAFGIGSQSRRQNLQRNLALQLRVVSGIDLSHPADTQRPENPVVVEGCSDHLVDGPI
jgi:hypothetical protein